MTDPTTLSAADIIAQTQSGTVSITEVITASLDRAARVDTALNCFTELYTDEAIASAKVADRNIQSGVSLGPLHGVPVAIKDFTPMAGKRTTRGSFALENWVPDADPVIVRRLRDAGAIIIGKTTTPEFANSSFTRSPLFGHTLNPWDDRCTSGGSSGGAGVAVATGCVTMAEGTDMGGSVRIPAALCGIVGLKPSFGRIPMDILATTFDTISHFGPLTRTIGDAALFLEVTGGPDDADIMTQMTPKPIGDACIKGVDGLRLAISPTLDIFHLDACVRRNFDDCVTALANAGARVETVELGWYPEMVESWLDMWAVYLAAAVEDLLDEHRHHMDPEFLSFVDRGLSMSAVRYRRLDEIRTRQWHQMRAAMHGYDALLCPTMAVPAPRADAKEEDFTTIDKNGFLHGLDMTSLFNSVGQCPALSVPSGMSKDGLPTGLQIIGNRYDDPMVLRIGAVVEAVRPWQPGLEAMMKTY